MVACGESRVFLASQTQAPGKASVGFEGEIGECGLD